MDFGDQLGAAPVFAVEVSRVATITGITSMALAHLASPFFGRYSPIRHSWDRSTVATP